MKDEKFIKNWEKARRNGKTMYLIEFSLATLAGILIVDFFIFVFFQLTQFMLIYSLVSFASMSVSLDYKWDKNEERYNKLFKNDHDSKYR